MILIHQFKANLVKKEMFLNSTSYLSLFFMNLRSARNDIMQIKTQF
ncbi:hypothetical protein RchiOBHm_Chr2g0167281 [Rosa chinensis]|uniref:Uncharacterized protein n=1 Tax=Rosa chinensis TaxID=74649 RepID=A0A2P6S493_ROSCH|nr:hypothetical protein RchiOBHm_Chr2g0167281 [Rosa chinensis]